MKSHSKKYKQTADKIIQQQKCQQTAANFSKTLKLKLFKEM